MKTAICLIGNNPNIFQTQDVYPDSTLFTSVDLGSFEHNIEKLAHDKQNYELNTKQVFDICVYINADTNLVLPQLETNIQPNTLYAMSEYTSAPTDLFFHYLPPLKINTDFFYCDSKTFNLMSLYRKWQRMISNQQPVPEDSMLYLHMMSVGIKNKRISL